MPIETVDAVVLGLGVGGETVANTLAKAGLSVVGVDEHLVGGECAYWGCIPTKIMVRGANLLAEARRGGVSTGSVQVRADWNRVARRVRDATDDWNDAAAVERFEDHGGRFERGRGQFRAPDLVEVDDKSFRAKRAVIIATGTEPSVPPIPGLDSVPYWTSRDAVAAESLPRSIAVIGGGSIGVEFAQTWQRFGVEVTLVESGERLLSREEPEASALVARVLRDEGVDVRCGVNVEQVVVDADSAVVLHLSDGETVRAARLLVATGRSTNLAALHVGRAGLDEQAKAIEVTDYLRAAPGIWAIGDVTGKGEFTHIATYQARIASADILGRSPEPARYHAVPRVTFSDPEVGAVGLTEHQATTERRNVRTACVDLATSSRGNIHGAGNDGLIKLVVDATTGILLGACSAGPTGGEVLSMLALAVHARITTDVLAEMIYAYPTFHRSVLDAVDQLRTWT